MLYGSVFLEGGSRIRLAATFFTTSSIGICSKCVSDFKLGAFVIPEQ